MSDSLPVADQFSVVIGLSVTVALVIVTSVIIVIGSLAVIIFLCQRQGTCGDNELLCVCVCHLFHI